MDLRDRRTAGVPLLAGAVNGALAYVAGLFGALLLYFLLGLRPLFQLGLPMAGRPGFTGVVFAHYGGHFVPTVVGGETVNFALEVASNGVLYVLLVAVVLGSTGYYLGAADGLTGLRERATAGTTLVLGYLPLVAASAALVEYRRTPTASGSEADTLLMEVPLGRAVLVAGILLPVLYGAAGGALAERAG